jgi:hypothetical protein
MLRSGRHKGNPALVHLRIEGMEPRPFDHRLELFSETCGELFDESLADAREFDGVPGKLERYFRRAPGKETDGEYDVNRARSV